MTKQKTLGWSRWGFGREADRSGTATQDCRATGCRNRPGGTPDRHGGRVLTGCEGGTTGRTPAAALWLSVSLSISANH